MALPDPLFTFGMTGRVTDFQGVLTCNCDHDKTLGVPAHLAHGKVWCEHLEHVVSQGLDTTFVADPQLDSVQVPIIPTEYFFVRVTLGKIGPAGLRPAWLNSGATRLTTSHTMPALVNLPDPVALAPIGPGEGRMVLRSLVIEWLRSQYRTAPVCRERRHRQFYGEALRARGHHHQTADRWTPFDKRTEPIRGAEFADLFSLLIVKRCAPCASAVYRDLSNDVPDDNSPF